MTDDAVDLGIDQLLRGGSALLRIGRVVFLDQFELDLLAVDHRALGVELVDRHLGAVLVVLAVIGLRAGQRRREADLHDLLSLCRAGR